MNTNEKTIVELVREESNKPNGFVNQTKHRNTTDKQSVVIMSMIALYNTYYAFDFNLEFLEHWIKIMNYSGVVKIQYEIK